MIGSSKKVSCQSKQYQTHPYIVGLHVESMNLAAAAGNQAQ